MNTRVLLLEKMFLNYLFSNKKKHHMVFSFYNVGLTFGPIGIPIIYHPTTNNIQVTDISKKYGITIFNDFLIVYGLSLCKL